MVNSSQIIRTYSNRQYPDRARDWRGSRFMGWYKYHGRGEVIPDILDFTTGKIGCYEVPDIDFDDFLVPHGNDSLTRLSFLGNAARNENIIAAALLDNDYILLIYKDAYRVINIQRDFREVDSGNYDPGYIEYKPIGYIRTFHLFPEGEEKPYALLYNGESVLLPTLRWRKISEEPDSTYDASLYQVLLQDPSLSVVYKSKGKIITI